MRLTSAKASLKHHNPLLRATAKLLCGLLSCLSQFKTTTIAADLQAGHFGSHYSSGRELTTGFIRGCYMGLSGPALLL